MSSLLVAVFRKMRLSSIQVISMAALCTLTSICNASSSHQVTVSVCHGDQLSLTCHTTPNVTLLQWSLTIPIPDRPAPDLRFITSSGSTTSVTPLIVGQTVFQFLRTLTSPLTSTMVINNVSTSVNGTRVECSYSGEVMETTIINVIGNGITPPTPVIEVSVISEQFENNSIVITVEWAVVNGAFDSLTIVPQVETMNFQPSTRQLMLSYNIFYNVTAVASLCGQYSSYSTELYYAQCLSPIRLPPVNNKTVVIANYSHPAIEGTIAMFSCNSSGYVLNGPSRATCMRNGEWVPDPRQVQCEAIDCGRPLINMNVSATYKSTLFNARLTLTCADGLLHSGVPTAQCYSNGSWTPNPVDFTCRSTSEPESENSSTVDQRPIISAVVSSVVTAVVFFILGCASGWFGHKYKDNIQAKSEKNTNTQPAPVYEDLQPISTSQDQKKAFELKENVAYGPLRRT